MARVFPVELPIVLALAGLAAGCSDDTDEPEPTTVTPAPVGSPYDSLSEWHIFSDDVSQAPNERVFFYDVISPLYSDYTFKRRFMWIPEGTVIGYADVDPWSYPVGSILVKSFSYPHDYRDVGAGEQLLETRLLVHEPSGWEAHTYVWNDEQTAAVREIAGEIISASWTDLAGDTKTNEYIVPNTNECQDCHGEKPNQKPLGPRSRQLDRGGQLEQLDDLMWFDTPPNEGRQPLVDPFGDAPESDRVRAYLDSNCGHCHTEGGTASDSALLLSFGFTAPTDDPSNWGVCKTPTSAGGATCGHTFDVVPGNPDESIMICRIASEEPEVRMPPVASRLPHDEGVALVRAWIEGLPAAVCD